MGFGRLIIKLTAKLLEAVNVSAANNKTIKNSKFKVIMTNCGIEKIKVIKEVREITGFGLAQAKNAVESCPFVIKSGVSEQEAKAIKKQFMAVGASVEIVQTNI
ncbi:MAG: ribosomal protein L7/L12 [Ruminococcaceae bacterium]|nr:ribosomal protein L7/L12 [Oscillospiraceae bacterium]